MRDRCLSLPILKWVSILCEETRRGVGLPRPGEQRKTPTVFGRGKPTPLRVSVIFPRKDGEPLKWVVTNSKPLSYS